MREIVNPPDAKAVKADPGPAPMLQWLKVADLVVDDSYQRELSKANWTAIRRIASQFRWSRFSPVFVAPIEGGRFAIVDGQHRAHAAALCGFETVPCQVVQMTPAEQAASFAAVNGLVIKVTAFQIFRAALMAGDGWAVESAKACSDAGCRLMSFHPTAASKKPGEIYAVSLVRRFVERNQGLALSHALRGLRLSKQGGKVAVWAHEILKPLVVAVVERPHVQQHDLTTFLDECDLFKVLDRAEKAVRARLREGRLGASAPDLMALDIGERLDQAFPKVRS